MRVPLAWLREYVAIELSPEALAERLTLLGMEVQGLERRGDEWRSVVVGELLEVAPHPNADRLSLTRVRVAEGGAILSIVCGATNIAAGQRVPVALPGAVLPGDHRIDRAPKMGVISEGMLCSGDELRLTADAEGILILPPESPLGRPLAELYGDVILDIDVKPNRGDALSLIGLAREVAAATGARLRWPLIEVTEEGDATANHLAVEVRDVDLCPRFVGRYLDGVRVGESPLAVQLRLLAAGVRPISNVVDASNYVMLELGKPIHTFDAAAIAQGRLIVRRAVAGERLETLDHVRRELTADTLLIADPSGPLAIAGVMGGASSEVGEGTTCVVVESAIFDPVSIRRTGHRYALRSEASLRFEKGQEGRLARLGADRTAQLIAAWAGGRPARGVIDTAPIDPPPARVPFRPARIGRLLGVAVPREEQRELLARLGIATEPAGAADLVPVAPDEAIPLGDAAGEALVAIIPSHRRDIAIEADLAEEVARMRGYETLPAVLPDTPMPAYLPDPLRFRDTVRDLLAGHGLSEVVAHALVAPGAHVALGLAADDPATIRVANPVSADHSQLRRELLPGLVGVLAHNERQRREGVGLFEVGARHRLAAGKAVQEERLGLLLAGDIVPGAWDQAPRAADLGDVKGLAGWLAERLGLPAVRFVAGDAWPGVEHPGRAALAVVDAAAGPQTVGRVAELHPAYLERSGARAARAVHGDLDLAALAALAPACRPVTALPTVPAVERDLALIVPLATAAGDVAAALRREAGELLVGLRLFDRYQGPPLGAGEVSLAYRLRLQAPDRTLTDMEVDALVEGIVGGLARTLGARLRA